MLVSHTYKFIFTKTVKTAGTSVEAYFEKYCIDPAEAGTAEEYRDVSETEFGIVGARAYDAKRHKWWNHMPAAQIKTNLGDEMWDSYFKFCCIRNPFDKALSAFAWWSHLGKVKVPKDMDDQAKFEFWLTNEGPPLDRNKYLINGKYAMDDVIRYEHLAEDVARISKILGLPPGSEGLPTFKTGIRAGSLSPDKVYTPTTIKIVERAYAFELKHFGYQFPSPAA